MKYVSFQSHRELNKGLIGSTVLKTHIAFIDMVMCGVDGFLKN